MEEEEVDACTCSMIGVKSLFAILDMCRWYKFTIIRRWGGNWLHIRDIVSSVHSLWWSGKPRLGRSGKPGILPQLGLEGVEPMAHATCCIQVPCCFISFCSQRPQTIRDGEPRMTTLTFSFTQLMSSEAICIKLHFLQSAGLYYQRYYWLDQWLHATGTFNDSRTTRNRMANI